MNDCAPAVSKNKTEHSTLAHNFAKHWPDFKIFFHQRLSIERL